MFTVGSLFSGIGGIEYGLSKQGFRTVWFVENDLFCQSVIRKRFIEAKIYGDIKEVDFRTVQKVDIITGGFPCQDISIAGKRIGIEGNRSSLWKNMVEAIRILRPKYCIIENVPEIVNRGLNVVLADLAKIRYDAEWYNLSASSVGAFHKRERIFIIAYNSEFRCLDREFQESGMEWSEQAQSEASSGSKALSYCEGIRLEGCRSTRKSLSAEDEQEGKALCSSTELCDSSEFRPDQRWELEGRKADDLEEAGDIDRGFWSVEPILGRVANGIPCRMDRIKSLGNAVVPPVAEVIAKAIKEYEEGKRE